MFCSTFLVPQVVVVGEVEEGDCSFDHRLDCFKSCGSMIVVAIDAESFILVELSEDSDRLVQLADVPHLVVLVLELPFVFSYFVHVEWSEHDDERRSLFEFAEFVVPFVVKVRACRCSYHDSDLVLIALFVLIVVISPSWCHRWPMRLASYGHDCIMIRPYSAPVIRH